MYDLKECPICGEPIDNNQTVCEACEGDYAHNAGVAKFRKKEHVINGNSWWRIKRNKKGA